MEEDLLPTIPVPNPCFDWKRNSAWMIKYNDWMIITDSSWDMKIRFITYINQYSSATILRIHLSYKRTWKRFKLHTNKNKILKDFDIVGYKGQNTLAKTWLKSNSSFEQPINLNSMNTLKHLQLFFQLQYDYLKACKSLAHFDSLIYVFP